MLRINEEIMENLEDNQSQLQNLLMSKHNAYFLVEVKDWLTKLSTADQVLSIYMEVSRSWTSLESIFIGTEDIRIQLPESSQRFDGIDKDFKLLLNDVRIIIRKTLYSLFPLKFAL